MDTLYISFDQIGPERMQATLTREPDKNEREQLERIIVEHGGRNINWVEPDRVEFDVPGLTLN